MFPVVMILAQSTLMAAAAANGGWSTPVGAALTLAALWCIGVNLGWFLRGGE